MKLMLMGNTLGKHMWTTYNLGFTKKSKLSNPVVGPEDELAMPRTLSPRKSSRHIIPTKRLLEEV